ncbi:Uncharacterised protein [Staphylococcus aureus]|uniref:Uncharacterized protein n=1 Tax=Staphylococcus aureus TaxID=1280 RepID=A0A2X2K1Z1_STAAU|nr:Uncharacterised protein [Staphylococcus aureus]
MTMPGLPKKPAALNMDVLMMVMQLGYSNTSCQLFNKDK